MAGQGHVAVAGGAESMSMVPMGGHKVSPNPWLMDNNPDAYINMGLTAENLAKKYGISRQAGRRILACQPSESARGDRCRQIQGRNRAGRGETTRFSKRARTVPRTVPSRGKSAPFDTDEGPRADTSLEALAKLKPVFHAHGVVTAGNSSQMSDGAAASVVMSAERARELGLKPLARFVAYATAGAPPEEMGIGPVLRDSQGAEDCGPHARSNRRDRIERSLRRAGAVGDQSSRASIPRASTSMAAPSRSAIRSVAPARS